MPVGMVRAIIGKARWSSVTPSLLSSISFARLSERRQQLSRKDRGPKRNAIIFSDDLLIGEASCCGYAELISETARDTGL